MNEKSAIVIGAGIAGISAALNLAKNGFPVTLFDGKPGLGGRFYSFKDNFTGEEIDNGQHLMMGAYRYFLELLNQLDTKKFLKIIKPPKFQFYYDNKCDILKPYGLQGKYGFLFGLMKLNMLSFSSKLNLIRFFVRLQLGLIKNKSISVAKLLKYEIQTEESIRRFWEPLVVAVMNSSLKDASAELLISVLNKAFFTDDDSSSIIIPNVSFSNLLNPFLNLFKENGGELYLNNYIKRIYRDGEYWTVVSSDGSEFKSNYLISTVNAHSLLKILADELSTNEYFLPIKSFRYSPIISVYMWFDKNFLNFNFASILDSPVQWVFNRRKLVNSEKNIVSKYLGHIAVTISGADALLNLTKEEIVNICFQELQKTFPVAANVTLLHSIVIKEKKATVVLDKEANNNRLNFKTPFKNFYIAGDWTQTGLPATLESAAMSGWMVSNLIIEDNS